MKFCKNCGKEIIEGGDICLGCGKPVTDTALKPTGKSKAIAGILAFTVGFIGINNFYLGQVKRGVAKILLTVLMLVLSTISLVVYANEYSEYQDNLSMNDCNYYYSYYDCDTVEEPTNLNVYYLLSSLVSFGVGAWCLTEAILIFSGKINKDSKGNLLV